MRIRRSFDFEAAHTLPRHAGKCRDLHGHSYRLVVTVERPVDPQTGMVIDFSNLERTVQTEAVEPLDHKYVNDLIENPTAEEMTVWIWNRLREPLAGLVEVELYETRNCSVVYRGN